VAEQRYQAVLAVISDGLSVSQVAEKVGVSRQTLHTWLARYEAEGLEGLVDRSHRPVSCPHQMAAEVEAALLELRRSRLHWGPRRLVFELAKRGVEPVPSESAAYRALVRAGMVDPAARDRRSRKWKRWERGAPMELWQMDTVGGFALADGTSAKALTGIDDHSRMCVGARLMARERTRAVREGLRGALARYGSPEQLLTDNAKVFTGRFNHPGGASISAVSNTQVTGGDAGTGGAGGDATVTASNGGSISDSSATGGNGADSASAAGGAATITADGNGTTITDGTATGGNAGAGGADGTNGGVGGDGGHGGSAGVTAATGQSVTGATATGGDGGSGGAGGDNADSGVGGTNGGTGGDGGDGTPGTRHTRRQRPPVTSAPPANPRPFETMRWSCATTPTS